MTYRKLYPQVACPVPTYISSRYCYAEQTSVLEVVSGEDFPEEDNLITLYNVGRQYVTLHYSRRVGNKFYGLFPVDYSAQGASIVFEPYIAKAIRAITKYDIEGLQEHILGLESTAVQTVSSADWTIVPIDGDVELPEATVEKLGLAKAGTHIQCSNGVFYLKQSQSGKYEDLESKPKINDVELSGNKSLSDLGIQQEIDKKQNKVYYGSAVPTNPQENDLWCTPGVEAVDFEHIEGYAEDNINLRRSLNNKQNKVHYGPSEPSGVIEGDLWCTDGVERIGFGDITEGEVSQCTKLQAALDLKQNKVFYGSDTPTNPKQNDLWCTPGAEAISFADITEGEVSQCTKLQAALDLKQNKVYYGSDTPTNPKVNDLWCTDGSTAILFKDITGDINENPTLKSLFAKRVQCDEGANIKLSFETRSGKQRLFYEVITP